MSLRDLQRKGDDAAAAEIVKKPVDAHKRPVTSPGAAALMAPTIDALKVRATKAEGRAAELEAKLTELQERGEGAKEIDVSLIEPNPWQPRRIFKEDELRKLAESIAELGLIQPVVVRRKTVPTRDTLQGHEADSKSVPTRDTFYELIAGERRLRAHQLLGLAKINAIVIEATNEYMALMALAENLGKEDLTDYEIGKAIRRAESEFKSRKLMAETIGVGRQDLYKYLAFSSLPDFVLGDLELNSALLGRNAAEQLALVLKKHGDKALDSMLKIWVRYKAGGIDQGKLATSVEAAMAHGKPARTERDIKKLFVGNKQAGSITRDPGALTIKLRAAALNAEQEERLRTFVEDLLRG